MVLLSNLTALATAFTTLNILDFSQTNAIDLSSGDSNCADFTTVQTWPYVDNGNQRWTLVGGSPYQILSPECDLYLTYPGVQSGAAAQRATVTTRSTVTSNWTISLVDATVPTGPWNIFLAGTTLALTAWDMDSRTAQTSAPVALELFNAGDTRQQFWFAG